MQDLESNSKEHVGFQLENGRLLYKGRWVLSSNSKFKSQLLQAYHSSPVGGHGGDVKTYIRIATEWHWLGIRKDVSSFVRKCEVCQQQKLSQQAPAGLLQPLPLPTRIWDDISMDFIEGLPSSKGFDTVFVVVDRLSKYAHFIALKYPFTAVKVAEVFVNEVVRLHGYPISIVSDRDKLFVSQFWRELFRLQGTALKFSTAYHPQTDGQTEIVNKTLETYLRCFVGGHPRSWTKWLPWAEYSYNTSPHLSTKYTPFKIVYGRDPPSLVRPDRSQTAVNSLEEILLERDAILDDLHFYLLRAQQKMKSTADRKRRDEHFEVGEKVFLRLQPYRQSSLARRQCEKLAAKFYGPFEIIAKVGPVAYKLHLPQGCRLHPVIHVSQLKRAVGNLPTSPEIPSQLSPDLELVVQPETLLAVRKKGNDQSQATEVLLKWKDLPEYEATWEDLDNIKCHFPEFHLEDKVIAWGRGNVIHYTDQPKSYARREKKGKTVKDGMVISEGNK